MTFITADPAQEVSTAIGLALKHSKASLNNHFVKFILKDREAYESHVLRKK